MSKEKNGFSQFVYMVCFWIILFQSASGVTVDNNDKTWTPLYTFVHGLFTGTPATILCLIALLGGVFGALVSSRKAIMIVGAVAIPIAIQVGPTIFEHVAGAIV